VLKVRPLDGTESTNYDKLCKTNPILSAVGGLQMNVSIFSKMAYENKSNWTLGENKPNTNPIKPNFTPSAIRNIYPPLADAIRDTNPIPQRDTQYLSASGGRNTRYKPNPPAPIFTPKITIAPKKQPEKPHFSPNLDNFSFQFC